MTVLSWALVLPLHPLRRSFAHFASDRFMTLSVIGPFACLPVRSLLLSLQWTCLWLSQSWASVPAWYPLRSPLLLMLWTHVSDNLVAGMADMCLLRSQLSSRNFCLTLHGWV